MTVENVILAVELVLLLLIWWDGRVMKRMSVHSVELQSQSLEAQKAYLDLRRRWYEQRSKKKEAVKDEKGQTGISVIDNPNPVQSG